MMGQQTDQDRFAGAVGAKDHRVLTVLDGQREPIQNGTVALDHRRVHQFQDGTSAHLAGNENAT
jgi:hypothetical protein